MKLPFVKRAPGVPSAAVPARRVARPAPIVERSGALEPGLAEVRRRLLASGTSSALCERLLAEVLASGATGTHAIDAAARVIAGSFAVRPSPKRGTTSCLVAFVGPPGAGKTTTLAKLGRRLQAAGRSVAFASFDARGPSAAQVAAHEADLDRTELPLEAVRGAAELARLVRRAREAEVVLIDTPGCSPREAEAIARLARELAPVRRPPARFEAYLVLPASASRGALELACAACAPLAPDAAVLTKLDETSEPAPALEAATACGLPIAFLCDGQDARAHLARPTPDAFADLLLRGRLA